MTEFGDSLYKVRSTDPRDLVFECNRVFELLSERLDRMEGLKGSPQLYAEQKTGYDIVHTDANTGVVLKDNATPPCYWRVTVDSTGTLVITNIGRA